MKITWQDDSLVIRSEGSEERRALALLYSRLASPSTEVSDVFGNESGPKATVALDCTTLSHGQEAD
jgi:hypothetical protein